MNVFLKIRVAAAFLGLLVVAACARSADAEDTGDRLAKLAAHLKQFDTNGNGMIDAEEAAAAGANIYLENRVFGQFGIQPHYPLPIADIMKTAEAQLGGSAPPAPSQGSTAPATAATSPPSAGTLPPSSNTQPSGGVLPAGTAGPGSAATGGKPLGGNSSAPQVPPVSAPPVGDVKPAMRKSGRFLTAKERLPAGLPDWFLKKADADGQISMAEYTDHWTTQTLAEFQKYDLNHDGIITAAECLKVEKRSGGR